MVNASSPHTRKMPAVIAVARLRYLGSSSPSSFSKSRFTGIRTNAETAKQRKPLTTGLAVGDSYTKMSQAIADVLGGDLAKAHRAISRGFQDVSDQTADLLRESPYMEVKEWCSAEDGDVRSAHRKLDGVVLPVAEEFEVDGKRAACPCGFGVAELDINCRCFLKYSLVLRSEFEDKRRKAKQEQPAAQNTPQVQAGQMTLSTASGQQTPAHAVAVQPTAPPEDGGTGTVYLPEKIEQEEDFKISKKNTSNGFSVNRGFVNSKKYHDQFDGLTEHKPANESVYQQAKRILEDRDGKDTERMAIIDARTGELLTDNLSIGEDSHFKTGLSFEEYQKIKDSGKRFLILHNHPSSTRPSITDILTFWKEEKADGFDFGQPPKVLYAAVGRSGCHVELITLCILVLRAVCWNR